MKDENWRYYTSKEKCLRSFEEQGRALRKETKQKVKEPRKQHTVYSEEYFAEIGKFAAENSNARGQEDFRNKFLRLEKCCWYAKLSKNIYAYSLVQRVVLLLSQLSCKFKFTKLRYGPQNHNVALHVQNILKVWDVYRCTSPKGCVKTMLSTTCWPSAHGMFLGEADSTSATPVLNSFPKMLMGSIDKENPLFVNTFHKHPWANTMATKTGK